MTNLIYKYNNYIQVFVNYYIYLKSKDFNLDSRGQIFTQI